MHRSTVITHRIIVCIQIIPMCLPCNRKCAISKMETAFKALWLWLCYKMIQQWTTTKSEEEWQRMRNGEKAFGSILLIHQLHTTSTYQFSFYFCLNVTSIGHRPMTHIISCELQIDSNNIAKHIFTTKMDFYYKTSFCCCSPFIRFFFIPFIVLLSLQLWHFYHFIDHID